MKIFYTLTLVFSYLFLSLSSSAQTYTGGTYTAVISGNWHNTSGSIWEPTEPPQNCNNCLITVNVNGTVDLNTSVTLGNGSALVIGGTGNTTLLSIGNSGASGFSGSYSIILADDGSNSTIQLVDGNAIVNASSAGTYDGILLSFNAGSVTQYFKQIGNTPADFNGNSVVPVTDPVPYGTLKAGPISLSSTGTLPIILTGFTAVADNSKVNLTWTTELEINSDHFVVQSSTNVGGSWNNIGTVAAHGNSSTPINYSFTDTKPANGTTEYRLEMVDKNGSTAYSTVVAVRIGLATSVSVYPNPASTYVNVVLGGSATGNVSIRLINTTGQVLMEKTVSNAAGTTVPLTVSNFPQGDYLIVVVGSDGTQQVNKLLITK
jgi:Secretion system C-terminal sorting domain